MAVGSVQTGYSTYSYPAKTKSAQKGMDFFSFAPNAPKTVKTEEMLYDLEHSLAGTKNGQTAQYYGQEKEFYKAIIQKLENTGKEVSGSAQEENEAEGHSGEITKEMEKERMDYQKFLKKKIEELYVKFQNGESEPSYQIGAVSFTEGEWDKLLEKFDALQESIRTQMREEHAKRMEEKERQTVFQTEKNVGEGKEEQAKVQETSLLAGAYTSATYPSSKPEEEPVHYITCYTEDGIFCRKAGETEGYEWSIRFRNKEEYHKVMEFLEQFPSDWNMRFASNENFWKDFLDDKIDLDEFREFLDGTDKGVPDYTITVGDSMYIDRDKIAWAKYMNQDIGKFYTAQEMEQMQAKLIAKNSEKLSKLTDPYENIYRLSHPEYRGEAIFCEYPGGPLYTANEIGRKMYQNYLESKLEIV